MDLKQDMLKNLGVDDQVVAYRAYENLASFADVSTAPGKAALREQLATFLAQELNATDSGGKDDKGKDKPRVPRYNMRARNQMVRLLAVVGGVREVPVLAAAMKHLDLRESARCALDRIDGEAATNALIAALNEVGPEFRAGVVNSLGNRSGAKVIKTLQPLITDNDAAVRLAAADALAKTADAGSDAALTLMSKQECPCARKAAINARIRLAENLAQSGKKPAARKIFQSIAQSDADLPQRKAAEIGLKSLG